MVLAEVLIYFFWVVLVLLFLYFFYVIVSKPRKSRKDYCTRAPDKVFGKFVGHCCRRHDEHYWYADISRIEADRRLRDCIIKESGFLVGWIYFIFVRLFGKKYYLSTKRDK